MRTAYRGLVLAAAAVTLLGQGPATAQEDCCPCNWSSFYDPASAADEPACPVAPPVRMVEVGVSDNAFGPATLTIAPGTRVQWMNHGRHAHTVTSETGLWDSREIGPGGGYAVTFMQPGTYPYYCRLHPREMRGTIVVR